MRFHFLKTNTDRTLLALIIIVNLTGLTNIIFSGDSALYASISKIMAERNNFLELFTINGGDWLDKPHFPFWVWAASIKLFGANTFAIKLPAILFFFMSIVYTYKFTREWYNKRTALAAVLILSSSMHVIISNNDVRAEPFLMGMLIGAVYHYYKLYKNFNFLHLLSGSIITACAIMTKGIFILIPIFSAVIGHALVKREFRQLIKWRWLLSVLLILIFTIPELYCLKVQFSDHPEKTIFGQKNISPLRFFFWDSQFGRFFNTGPIKGKGNILFYTYNLVWAFFPWVLFLYLGAVRIFRGLKEYYAVFASLIILLIFSFSKFQLSHYTNIIFPFFAILVANILYNGHHLSLLQRLKNSAYFLGGLLLVAAVLFCFLFRPGHWIYIVPLVLFSGFLLWKIKQQDYDLPRLLVYNFVVIMIFTGLFLNVIFYPALQAYEPGYKAAKYVNTHYRGYYTASHGLDPHLYDYYLENELHTSNTIFDLLDKGPSDMLLFTPMEYVEFLRSCGKDCKVLQVYPHYHITKLSLDFINYKKRPSVLDQYCLVEIHQ